ncbi:MAG: hypothetical protein K9M10_03105 [Candidatus Pacebacteria bacterium]|nr:hypothetical protein [Candidatus Paceibacterota bacterium]MCF7857442.1 hypothetical protein [Candidatus Paceibacterota bacterium]
MRTLRVLFFTILSAFALNGYAEESQMHMRIMGTNWKQVNDHSWLLVVEKPHTEIVLITVEKDLYFTASKKCRGNEYTEQYWWKYGDTFAKGQTCGGRTVRMETSYWKDFLYPLPEEVRE